MKSVVEPRSTGIGGDAFALHWPPGAPGPAALAGAGPSPPGLTIEELTSAGIASMPQLGPWTVTVPGAVSAWEALLARFGTGIQDAIDAPRVRFIAERKIAVEPHYDPVVAEDLERRGHVVRELDRFSAGGAQAIVPAGDRLDGASDPRKDGRAIGG
jgi:gamma-glutamyltranspeptidase